MHRVPGRVAFSRRLHCSPSCTAHKPTVTKKPFSDLPKRSEAPSLLHADNDKAFRRKRGALPTTSEVVDRVTPDPDPARPRRGRKPRTTPSLGPGIVLSETRPKHPRNSLATGILANHSRFPHCILLTRVGQFYESYFDQANEVARLLGIKLTSRVWDKQSVSMCGFPIMHLDKYIKILVQQHKLFVAMCEEFPRHTNNQKPEFDRRVVRVITPGTLIDEQFLNPSENNFLLAIGVNPLSRERNNQEIGLAWIDVSTGEFFTKATPSEALKDELARISPREIVLTQELSHEQSDPIQQLLKDEGYFLSYAKPSGGTPDQCDSSYTPMESMAVNILTTYLRNNLMEYMPLLSNPNREGHDERMQIDSHTIKALEICESAREGGVTGTLLSVVKRTVTSSGTRSLSRRLCSPSTSRKEIETWQSLVAFFHDRPHVRDDIVRLLQDSEDACRIVQRFLSCRGEPKDLLAINRCILTWTAIRNRIGLERSMECQEKDDVHGEEWNAICTLLTKMTDLDHISARITLALQDIEFQASLDDESTDEDSSGGEPERPSSISYGVYKWTIRPQFSEDLATLHERLHGLLERRGNLERELQTQYNAPSLTLRTSPAHGMHVHVARARRDEVKIKNDSTFISISGSASTSSYFYQPWSQLGSEIAETTTSIGNAERELFNTLRDEVKAFSAQLRHNAQIVDELDVALGFANLASEMGFVRPLIKDDTTYEITNGRHPTVELGLLTSGRVFTPNSVSLKPHSRLHIITGPNMAGKSTFLRQTALTAILAQTGSFVPAESAVVGIVDKLFSRVGAKDDLFRDRSTFMVEMLETAEILRRATARSLVIMDEVGRGTTVGEGLAIAFAAVHHLVVHNRCRALFATHFHELADLLSYNEENHRGDGVFRDVGFFCTDVHEAEDNFFTYSHRLRPGVNRDSHGLKVAQLAGVPRSALLLAQDTLTALRKLHLRNPQDLSEIGQKLTTATTDKGHTA